MSELVMFPKPSRVRTLSLRQEQLAAALRRLFPEATIAFEQEGEKEELRISANGQSLLLRAESNRVDGAWFELGR